eukprot:TRINITY_DN18561_c0_g1_i2.p1 TRINITY_DN18561_c0_g1~~TRINITY_DN18561_c0_g1_i2.p1  ORF type:complete len:144 (-),score=10.62 TRINITY_DN18561_c0_g1_i2:193-624(-)
MPRTCPNCGSEVAQAEAAFCYKCGHKLDPEVVRSEVAVTSEAPIPQGGELWTCKLCSQRCNPEEMQHCKTCARPRGHLPERYEQRRKQIRSGSGGMYDDDEPGSWTDYWGMILGITIFVVLIGGLVLALRADLEAELRDQTEL